MYSPSIVKSRVLEEVVTVNEPDDVAVPPGVTTEIGPVVAPLGTAVEIWLASAIENVAPVLLNFTIVAPVKFVPVSVHPWFPPPRFGVRRIFLQLCSLAQLANSVCSFRAWNSATCATSSPSLKNRA